MKRVVVAVAAGGLVAALALAQGGGDEARWRTLKSSPLQRTEVGAARVGRQIYVLGGFGDRGGRTLAAMVRYDIARNRWQRAPAMPVGVNHPAVAAAGGKVYVVGGYTGADADRAGTTAVQVLDPKRDRWRRGPSLPQPTGAACAAASNGELYVAGGFAAGRGATAELWRLDLKTNRWSRGPDMGKAREHLACAASGGSLYVLAGRVDGNNFTTLERFDGTSWTTRAEMAKSRGGIGAATLAGGDLVVVGGEESAGTIREVERYDPAADRWSPLPDLPTPRHGLGVVSDGDRVFVLEGGPSPGFAFSNKLEVLNTR